MLDSSNIQTYDDKKHWEVFLQTLLNNPQITVVNLTEETVKIECGSVETKSNTELLLSVPHKIREGIIHSVFENEIYVPELSPQEFLEKVLDESFLEGLDLRLSEFKLDPSEHKWVLTQDFPNKTRLTLMETYFKLTQSALSDPKLALFLNSNTVNFEKIREEQPDSFVSEIVKNQLLQINKVLTPPSLEVTMDIAGYCSAQMTGDLYAHQEQSSSQSSLIFNKKELIKYFNKLVGTGTIYKKEDNDTVYPILALSSILHEKERFELEKSPRVIILMDTSKSMQKYMNEYKKNILSIIGDLRELYKNTEIEIYTFNSEVNLLGTMPSLNNCETSPSAQQTYLSVLDKVETVETKHKTSLYLAIEEAVKRIKTDSNDVIFLFSDGKQNPKMERGEENILEKLRQKRCKNPQFSMYAFGAGDYDKDFFTRISQNIGASVENLGDNFNMLSLTKYLSGIGQAKTVVEFLSSTGILTTMQVTADQPKVSDHSLPLADIIKMGIYVPCGREERAVFQSSGLL